MRLFVNSCLVGSFVLSVFFCSAAVSAPLKLWYRQPAGNWNEALPVGNGRLGAMVFGNVTTERLQLNEETVWTGRNVKRRNPEALVNLATVRKLLFQGKYTEAQQLAQDKIMGKRLDTGLHTYQTLGDLTLTFDHAGEISDYKRELDLEQAIASVTYSKDNIQFSREIFASAPGQAIIIELKASEKAQLTCNVELSRPGDAALIKIDEDGITMTEHVGNGEGVRMVTRLQVNSVGGRVTKQSGSLFISKADAVTLYIIAATDYRGKDPKQTVQSARDALSGRSYEMLRNQHIADYQTYFKRVNIDLGSTDATFFPTDARLAAVRDGYEDPHLIGLYYQYGRYLLISSSRPGCLPANLQGIWADGLKPPWNSDYHININIQMNYWLAETTNLSECHRPFLELLRALRPNGRITAREVYGCRGFVAHHTTDVWHFTDPIGKTQYGMWPMGAAWSCQHLWEHFLFNEDEAYLREFAYPVMKEAALFCLEFLVTHPDSGYLVSGPSISPENRFYTETGETATMVMGPTMDQMIIRDLFLNCIAATGILNIDLAFRNELQLALDNLAPTRVGDDGRLMEWTEQFDEPAPGHRHISHLFGLHPGNQISKALTPDLFAAARKTIEYRLAHGGGHTGWSRAWIINFFARLQDGDSAYQHILALLRRSTLVNLFDTHPPFQIDGNFGATAGITEMLLQSQSGEIHLLPALPAAWPQGSIKGICARGGFIIDIDWQNKSLSQVKVHSKFGNTCRLRYGDSIVTLKTEKNADYHLNPNMFTP
jgi:alpha-L-fucosidase 2